MNKTIPLMQDCMEIFYKLRRRYYGEEAKPKDYKDSYIINRVVNDFDSPPNDLMDIAITKIEESAPKMTKSVNFRSDIWDKLSTIGEILQITPMEVCRRIIIYTVQNGKAESTVLKNDNLSVLKSKLYLLEVQLTSCIKTHAEIMDAIRKLEGGANNDN